MPSTSARAERLLRCLLDITTCALLDNGDVKCWGLDGAGQLGDGGTSHSSSTYTTSPPTIPINLGTGRTAVAISAGVAHTCAILDNGDLKCWDMANGDSWAMDQQPTPTRLHPLRLTSARAERPLRCLLESYHTCVILDNDDVNCWGQSHFGQVGDGGGTGYPTYVTSPSPPQSISAQAERPLHFLVGITTPASSLTTASMKCWGGTTKDRWATAQQTAATKTHRFRFPAVNTWDNTTTASSGSGSGSGSGSNAGTSNGTEPHG